MPWVYFCQEGSSRIDGFLSGFPHIDPGQFRRVMIGTAAEVKAYFDPFAEVIEGIGHVEFWREVREDRRTRNFPLRVRAQMEGDERLAAEIRERFVHWRVAPLIFYPGADLVAFIDAEGSPWDGEDAAPLSVKRPIVPQGVARPTALGLADRLKRASRINRTDP